MKTAFYSFKRCLVLTALLVLAVAAVNARPLSVTFLDVEEADAVCIQTPDGRTILIDGGSPPYVVDGTQVQSREALPLLKKHGISRLDAVVLSHSHGDHAGGLVQVLAGIPVGMVYDSGYGENGEGELDYSRCRELIREKGIPYHKIRDGERLDWGKGLTVEAFLPSPGTFRGPNDNSLIIRMTYGKTSFLFAGDAQADEEGWAARRYGGRIAADVLKVGHHGSGTSSSRKFLNAVRPRIAVISCGMDNPFGHPHAQTLRALKKAGIRIYRTDYDGDIHMIADGGCLSVETGKRVAK